MSPFMDMIRNMGRNVLLKGRKLRSVSFIPKWQLKMSEESHSERVEITIVTLRQFDVPLSSDTCESPLKKSKMDRIINI